MLSTAVYILVKGSMLSSTVYNDKMRATRPLTPASNRPHQYCVHGHRVGHARRCQT